ncbi:Oxidoreductase, N-terminal [Penicillium expansum]|uniref:Oxidoreductase, N-terminal n=1 Tax=Penicillium expansum TaxID=27334 RepID=A0A0A2JR91_PENEN|nr:Oxidoreductase, N-terminal [Penicillium expansum]KGO43423.1 Oxidoreductase, N-terminal [Penicillium expansum]KGO57351.1 Oxidoreductase, N-terminal [Penicillium expansum]KGO71068.1 Oxidoreductase, N-terminal [Penicillium expansum]
MPDPIRIALFGLSADPKAWANGTHLPALKNNPHYRIVALVNSSVSSARTAIEKHGLDSDVKAYDNPQDAADDPNVDLAVISVNVASHYKLVKPCILAGKDIFVEWPLAANTQQAKELTELAKVHQVKNIVGLQERIDPCFLKIKEIIDSGKIGNALNTTINARGMVLGPGPVHQRIQYFLDDESGGNLLTIPFLHLMDGVFSILGKPKNYQTLLHKGMPPRNIVDDDGKVVVADYDGTAHDQIAFHGILQGGTMITMQYRQGGTMDQGLRWYIYGTKGEIEITSSQPYIAFIPESVKIRVHEWATDTITDVPVVRPDHFPSELQGASIDLYGLYEAFWNNEVEKFASFEDAVEMHAFLDEVRSKDQERTV